MYEFQARLPKIMTLSIVYSRVSGGNIAKKILKACEFISFACGCSLFVFLRGMTPKPNLGEDCCSARPYSHTAYRCFRQSERTDPQRGWLRAAGCGSRTPRYQFRLNRLVRLAPRSVPAPSFAELRI